MVRRVLFVSLLETVSEVYKPPVNMFSPKRVMNLSFLYTGQQNKKPGMCSNLIGTVP